MIAFVSISLIYADDVVPYVLHTCACSGRDSYVSLPLLVELR